MDEIVLDSILHQNDSCIFFYVGPELIMHEELKIKYSIPISDRIFNMRYSPGRSARSRKNKFPIELRNKRRSD